MPYNSMGGPADWAALQSSQKNDNFQNLIQMFASLMKWKGDRETQQGQFGQELGWQKEKFAQEKPMEERRVRAYEEAVKPKTQMANPSDFEVRLGIGQKMGLTGPELIDFAMARQTPKPEKSLDRLREEAEITESTAAKYRKTPATQDELTGKEKQRLYFQGRKDIGDKYRSLRENIRTDMAVKGDKITAQVDPEYGQRMMARIKELDELEKSEVAALDSQHGIGNAPQMGQLGQTRKATGPDGKVHTMRLNPKTKTWEPID